VQCLVPHRKLLIELNVLYNFMKLDFTKHRFSEALASVLMASFKIAG
jgi:hypothetical protein